MITREQIRNLLNGIGDETISKSDADQMAADYPYFSIPQLLYLKFTPGAMPDEKRIQQALIYASPHAHLETILGVEGESFADLYPKAPCKRSICFWGHIVKSKNEVMKKKASTELFQAIYSLNRTI